MSNLAPHRGILVLVLGILSLVLCPITGIFAWILGKGDLNQIDQGEMDPEGRGMTQAGMICGIIGTILMILSIVAILFLVLFMGISAREVSS
jgi:hypothetical protein